MDMSAAQGPKKIEGHKVDSTPPPPGEKGGRGIKISLPNPENIDSETRKRILSSHTFHEIKNDPQKQKMQNIFNSASKVVFS